MKDMRERPLGVTILAFLALIAGLIGLCIPATLLIAGGFLTVLPGFFSTAVGLVGVCAGILLILSPVLYLAVAYGALNLYPWAWWLAIIASGISVVGAVLNIFDGAEIWPTVASSALPIIIFIYVLTPGVRRAFQIGSSD